jgi:hypothetical protein
MFRPVVVIAMEFRLADLENPARQHGVTLGQVAERKTQVEELQKASPGPAAVGRRWLRWCGRMTA